MARPIPDANVRKVLSIDEEIKPSEIKSILDITVSGIKSRPTKNLILGTFSGWVAGVSVVRVGKIAAFGLGGGVILLHFASECGYIYVNWERIRESAGHSQAWAERMLRFLRKNSCYSVGFVGGFFFAPPIQVMPSTEHERILPPEPVPPKPPEPYRTTDHSVFEKPAFVPPKPVPHSPKISPSSIPIPNPSVTTNKVEAAYPSYGGYLYSVPGFSAFQPVSYPGVMHPNQAPIETSTEFAPFANITKDPVPFQKEPFPIREGFSPAEDIFPTVKDELPNATRKDPFTPVSKECCTNTPTTEIYSPGTRDHILTPVTTSTSFPTAPTKEHLLFPAITTRESVSFMNIPTTSSTFPTKSTKEPISLVSIKDTVYPPLPPKDPISFSTQSPNELMPISSVLTKLNDERKDKNPQNKDISKIQTDFEENFTPEIIPVVSISENNKTHCIESKLSITSLAQGSGATVTIPPQNPNKGIKKKPTERFSLKTSIPISKIDIKCMNTSSDSMFHSSMPKRTLNTVFPKEMSKIEIQSNIVIKSATKETEIKSDNTSNAEQHQNILATTKTNNSISTLINAAEAISKNENQFQVPEPKSDVLNEVKDPLPVLSQRPKYNPVNIETNKVNFSKPLDGTYNEQKNQILFIQNKSSQNPKMLLTIQQQNPHVLLQRANFDPKNLQAPSRLSTQANKSKEEIVSDCNSSKQVVALKRLHQENCDENDFENLITENQIYGNKIVVKEKSQGTLQEQELKSKKIMEKLAPSETKTTNVVIQPNIVYLSNVQFPNLMMIKNNPKITQTTDCNLTRMTSAENKVVNEASTMTNNDFNIMNKTSQHNVAISKELHVMNSSNNMIQTLPNITKPEVLITNQKVIMNPQILYQMPMIVDSDQMNQTFTNREYPKLLTQKNELNKQFESSKANDKLYIACPYQMDSKLQPKIVITNIRPKITKVDEISELDSYEKRRRMRRLKYLSNRDVKDVKSDSKKVDRHNVHIITPDKMKNEIIKEFTKTKVLVDDGCSDSDTDDYGEEELREYGNIIEEYSTKVANENNKAQFLANFNLGTISAYKEKKMEMQEKALKYDAVAAAYIAVGRLDVLPSDAVEEKPVRTAATPVATPICHDTNQEGGVTLHRKQMFLSRLRLKPATTQYKEDYEKVWQEIMKERKRRNGVPDDEATQPKTDDQLKFDPNGQLQILTQIKKSVNENNNLIKKRLDSVTQTESNQDSIRVLADKNFSELNRLSKMADRSVKLLSGQDMKKRDLNPGFDSENIQKSINNKPNYPKINIPNISRIVALKTTPECCAVRSTPATSMDEPRNSAAGVGVFTDSSPAVSSQRDYGCQVQEVPAWPGIKTLLASYKEFEAGRKRMVSDLHRRNTALRVESSQITRGASRDTDSARALLAERRNLAAEETRLRHSVQQLCAAIQAIRNYS